MHNSLSDDNSEREPPEPISNSEVKPLSADGSVMFRHVRVGHRQAFIPKKPPRGAFFIYALLGNQLIHSQLIVLYIDSLHIARKIKKSDDG